MARIATHYLYSGFVDANADLDCEVVFHPSFMAPEEGLFALQIHGGNTLKLKCKAKVGNLSSHTNLSGYISKYFTVQCCCYGKRIEWRV